ncbi:rhodanese-like domain-containing protein [Desulfonatronovibrio hydrogenovorans]|uniref:rhodanese-like domain-containing protein n=1 Tax=Desulfonatronovibrio hydrogenovorans TaxID=53245 RepID=UPI00048E23B1|nr:rhodanese-like domain-containing protein [Desulfonatronovibrio hydrogenovorans]
MTTDKAFTPDRTELEKQLVRLERQAYHLNIINESLRELTLLEDQEEILEKFLLTLMGAMGTACAFVIKIEQHGESTCSETRGISEQEASRLQTAGSEIYAKFFSHLDSQEDVLPKQVRLTAVNEYPEVSGQDIIWPARTRLLVQWTLDSECFGFIGLGSKIDETDYYDRETDFLLSMTEVLMDSLKLARSSAQVRMLNNDLMLKNQQLGNALSQARKAQMDLDRQLFHFKALSETSRELSGIFDKKKLLDNFLLMAQGTISARSGFIILFDALENTSILSRRGDQTRELQNIDKEPLKKFVLSFYPSPACFSLPDFKVQSLKESIASVRALNLPVDTGIVFSLDENYYGIMGFSSKITQQEFTADEEDLLVSLCRNFLLSLENVLSFEIIQKLNLDLGRRNYELSKTIEELRQARDRVNVLQKARNRISGLVQKEALRLERVGVLDFAFIIVLTLVLSLTYNLSSPAGTSPIPETWTFSTPPSIETDWAALKHRNKASIFVDARPNEFYNQERIAGAVSLPLNLFDFIYMMRFATMDPQKEIIVYGRNISRRYDEKVAHELILRGHKNVLILPGGLREWKKLNLPVEP